MNCAECGKSVMEIAEVGRYLKRRNPLGEEGVFVCSPSCESSEGGPEDALLNALEQTTGDQNEKDTYDLTELEKELL